LEMSQNAEMDVEWISTLDNVGMFVNSSLLSFLDVDSRPQKIVDDSQVATDGWLRRVRLRRKHVCTTDLLGVSINGGTPNGWFIMENQ
jgi:hypothetical protein